MGIYAVNKSILNLIPKNKYYGFDHLMKKMIKKKFKSQEASAMKVYGLILEDKMITSKQ